MSNATTHRKQYLLGPKSVQIQPDWIVRALTNQLFLSHCPFLQALELRSKDGVEFCLLGLAIPSDEPGSSIALQSRLKTADEIEAWSGCWAGRWLLISPTRCIQDAAGLLGLCYRHVGDTVWISSSPAILGSRLPETPVTPRLPWQVKHEVGMDWIPAPFTTREGVFKALPLRAMDPRDGNMRPVLYAAPKQGDSTGQLVETMKTIMVNWGRSDFDERFVGMTAGLDTRTVFSAAVGAKILFSGYTVNFPFTDRRDIVIPPRLAARVDVPHKLYDTSPVRTGASERAAAISEHMDGATFSPAATHFLKFTINLPDDRSRTIATGNGFEVGRCYYWDKFAKADQADQPTGADGILAAFKQRANWNPEPLDLWRLALDKWIASLSEPMPLKMDWRDRFYHEQRSGAWMATNLMIQGGSNRTTPFYPGNCLWVSDLMLRHAPELRKQGTVQREIIQRLTPRLLDVPINPQPLRRRIKERVRGLFARPRAT